MPKVLIAYATRAGGTKKIADMIAKGVDIKPVTAIKKPEDLKDYDAYAFGSATYHGSMIQAMKKMLFMAERAGLEGKIGVAFGPYGWSGEAPVRIFETMKNIFKMKMIGQPLKIQTADIYKPEVKSRIEDIGREIAKNIREVHGK